MYSETEFVQTPLAELDVDVVVVSVATTGEALVLAADAESINADGALLALLEQAAFSGAWGAQLRLNNVPGVQAHSVLVVGTGPELEATPSLPVTLREPRHALAAAVLSVSKGRIGASSGGFWDELLIEALMLGTYRFDRYTAKSRPEQLVISDLHSISDAEVADTRSRVQSVCFARDWVSMSPSDKRPSRSEAMLVEEAQRAGLEVHVWSTQDLIDAHAGGITAVGQGSVSSETARIVQLTAQGSSNAPPLVLVGKGLTYDAGGINLKTTWLEHMKLDIGGAAAVAGALLHAGRRPGARTLQGWIALSENLMSATSFLTGDVLRMHNGLSVEILNTDAEGRLVLADAMSLAEANNAAAVITVATLTGAAIRAFGGRTAAMMTTDDGLAATIEAAGAAAGESLWRMPCMPHYADTLKSNYADLNNLGTAEGQTMVAATFLQRFAPQGVPYAHFDLAGPAFNMGEPYDGVPAGGTGYGVRTLIEVLRRI